MGGYNFERKGHLEVSEMGGKRIATFLLHPNTWWGGAQIAYLRLITWLAQKGISSEIIVARVDGDLPFRLPDGIALTDLRAPVVKVKSKPVSGMLALVSAFKLAQYLRHKRPDVLIGGGYDGWVALLGSKLTDTSTRFIFWEQASLMARRRHASSLREFLAPSFARLYRRADVLVACSQGVADELARLTGKPRGSIWVIYNPLPPDLERRAEEPLDHPWFAPDQPPVILSVGRLSPEKDFPTLLKAFWHVRRHHRVRLVILGEGSERGKLEGMVRRMGLEGEVSLLGFVENPFKFMKRAKVFVLSSRFEGFPLVLVEALALGMRVVATDCESGPREILGGGRWGILVSVGDAEGMAEGIGRMLEGEVDREALVRRGREFSLERVGTQWLKLLKDLG